MKMKVAPHKTHPRLLEVKLDPYDLEVFLDKSLKRSKCNASKIQALNQQQFNLAFHELILLARDTITSRCHGGLTLSLPEPYCADERLTSAMSSAFGRALGEILPEDTLTHGRRIKPQEHVEITLKHVDHDVGRLAHFADPKLPWPLHTDRAFKADPGDWLLVCKAIESGAEGGKIRLLHVDDIDNLKSWLDSPLSWRELTWAPDRLIAPGIDRLMRYSIESIRASLFFEHKGQLCIRYTDWRFRKADSESHAEFLTEFGERLEKQAAHIPSFHLPVGALYLINNRFMLHGREGFKSKIGFERKLLRFCGLLNNSEMEAACEKLHY